MRRTSALLMAHDRPRRALGVLAAAGAVTAATLLVYPLKHVAPVLSLSVVYLLTVLVVAALWGAWLGVPTALLSAAAFDFFHLPPVGGFSLRESQDWVALVAFLIAAAMASIVAEVIRARGRDAEERRQEADLAAELARLLLRGGRLDAQLPVASQRLAAALGLDSATIRLGVVEGDARQIAFPLREGARRLGTLTVPAGMAEASLRRLQERVAPALEALLSAALEREELLSDVVETEALRSADAVKTALLRAVSHDLRSPLTAIRTAAEGASTGDVGEAARAELLSVIVEETGRLSRLVDNLLDLSRLEAGAAAPHQDWLSVAETVHDAVEELAGGGRFSLSVADDLPLIRADAIQLERALVNVLENAVRHSGGHPVSVRARAIRGRVVVRVVDRGPGIPPAQLERVFEPFYRAGTGVGERRGSGLGLAIARGFVQANGGTLRAESLPGQGAVFVFELPVAPAPSELSAAGDGEHPAAAPRDSPRASRA